MEIIRRVVREAARRLWINDFLHSLAVALAAAAGLAVLTRVVERALGLEHAIGQYWKWIFIGLGAAAFLTSAAWASVVRRKPLHVAVEVDERAGLRESLSTAMAIEKHANEPWSAAVIDSAKQAAAGVKVPVVVPVETPRFWPAPIGGAIALLLAWYAMPSLDLLGKKREGDNKKAKEAEVALVKSETKSATDKLKEVLAKADPKLLEELGDAPVGEEQKPLENDPDAIRRAALKEMTDLTSKLEEARQGEKAMQSEALRKAMEKLKQPGPGPLDQFSRNLSRGDFAGAEQSLEQLNKQLEDNSMSAEAKEQLKKQMENLSEQIKELAKDQQELVKKLQQEGLDKKTAEDLAKKAGDPAQLQKALEQLKQLTPEQQQELMKMAQACNKAGGQCENMSQALSKAAQGMSQQGLQQEGAEGISEMMQELSQSEMMQSDMENLEAAMKEAKSQMAKMGGQCNNPGGNQGEGECEGNGQLGQWRQGESNKFGQGSGGAGKGNGDGPEENPADFEFDKKKAKSPLGEGPMIGSRLVYGDQVKGESKAQFTQAVEAGEKAMAEGLENQRIPREMENAVKKYFGNLKNKAATPQPEPPKK
jgi:hypothetical protein